MWVHKHFWNKITSEDISQLRKNNKLGKYFHSIWEANYILNYKEFLHMNIKAKCSLEKKWVNDVYKQSIIKYKFPVNEKCLSWQIVKIIQVKMTIKCHCVLAYYRNPF